RAAPTWCRGSSRHGPARRPSRAPLCRLAPGRLWALLPAASGGPPPAAAAPARGRGPGLGRSP
ncbi:unnamed protein product, partial [Prorocentrum cordatum]